MYSLSPRLIFTITFTAKEKPVTTCFGEVILILSSLKKTQLHNTIILLPQFLYGMFIAKVMERLLKVAPVITFTLFGSGRTICDRISSDTSPLNALENDLSQIDLRLSLKQIKKSKITNVGNLV